MKKQVSAWIWLMIGGLLVVTMACGSSTQVTSYDNPPAVTSTVLRPTVEAAQVEAYQSSIQAQHTLDAVHAMETATAVAERQTATAIAVAERRTATAQAAHKTATAVAIQATASVEAARATATQGAAYANATATAWQTTVEAQQAAATATARAASARATATTEAVRATSTAHTAASNATATAEMSMFQIHATATKGAANAIATAQAAQAQEAELRAERQRMIQPLMTYGPWILLIVIVVLMAYGALRLLKVFEDRKRVVETQTGQILIVDGRRVGMPTRQWGPMLDLDERPSLSADAEQQDNVTRRDQITGAIRASHPPTGSSGSRSNAIRRQQEASEWLQHRPRSVPTQSTFRGAPGIRRVYTLRQIEHAVLSNVVPPKLGDAIQQDWKSQVVEGEYRELDV
jgi:hypothetical protein